jgi:hypothetical protein
VVAENSPAPLGPRTRREALEAEREKDRGRGGGRGRLPSGFKTIRDLLSFGLGVSMVVHEVFFAPSPDAYLVGVGVGFCGLPLVLGADERKAK